MRSLFVVVLCVALSACSRVGSLVIINNLGALVSLQSVVTVDEHGLDVAAYGWPKGLRLPDRSRTKQLLDEHSGWRLQLRAGSCRFWYFIPQPQEIGEFNYPDTVVQLNNDGAFYLVGRRDYGSERYVQIAAQGFPVFPLRNSCDQ